MNVFAVEGTVSLLLALALLGVKAFAFINATTWSKEAYEAAGKLSKTAWLALLGIGLGFQVLILSPTGGIIGVVFTVAAIVYLVDVKPALAQVTGRR